MSIKCSSELTCGNKDNNKTGDISTGICVFCVRFFFRFANFF